MNATAVAARGDALLCPSDGSNSGPGQTNYAACIGDGRPGVLDNGIFGTLTRPQSVVDGMTTTATMSEILTGVKIDPAGAGGGGDRLRTFHNVQVHAGADDAEQFESRCRGLDGVAADPFNLKGDLWYVGAPYSTLYDHFLTINQPSCNNFAGTKSVLAAITAGSMHPGGANCLYADGHVRFIRDTVDPLVWRATGTKDGGELATSGTE